MITARQVWLGLVILLLVMLLVVAFTTFWFHITGLNHLPLLGEYVPQGC